MAKMTISFVTQENDSNIKIENDTERNSDHTGRSKSRFRYGDTAYFRIYAENPQEIEVFATDGELKNCGIFSSTESEILSFIDSDTAETDKNISSIESSKWLGKSLGEVSKSSSRSVKSEESPEPSSGKIALLKISYASSYLLYGLSLSRKDEAEYPVAVYVGRKNV